MSFASVKAALGTVLCLHRVSGSSMEPLLREGDYVLTSRFRRIKPGRLVVTRHSHYPVMVKQVKACVDGRYTLEGLSDQSVSSEDMGLVSPDQIIGVVLRTICAPRDTNDS